MLAYVHLQLHELDVLDDLAQHRGLVVRLVVRNQGLQLPHPLRDLLAAELQEE